MTTETIFLQSTIKRLSYYKDLGDKTFKQLTEKDFHFKPNEANNSIAIIIQHIAGNMLSRWTNFLTEDGEKNWRNRDNEFETQSLTKQQLIDFWQQGWQCCLTTISNLKEVDLSKTIYIRTEGLTVVDAINRQLTHYPYHVGQIVYIAKIITDANWKTLSIAKKQSNQYNQKIKKGEIKQP